MKSNYILSIRAALLAAAIAALGVAHPGHAQERPPSPVVTAKARAGAVSPSTEFVGTVYFKEEAQVATETAGKVARMVIDEGDVVLAGRPLAKLSTDLLEKDLAAALAARRQAESEAKLAELDYARMRELLASGSVSQQEHDQKRYSYEGLARRVESLNADVQRLELEIQKAVIPAPFTGVVLERLAEHGEWLDKGQAVAVLGRTGDMEAVFNVPQQVIALARPGMEVSLAVAGRQVSGTVAAVVPRGDAPTRTFPVKIDIAETDGLAQSMEARVQLPSGPMVQSVLVDRDALLNVRGQQAVWVIKDGVAAMLPASPVGFQGSMVGVRAQGLEPGMEVVVKGNERLQPGQPVAAQPREQARTEAP